MLKIDGGPLVYAREETGELWARLSVDLNCRKCSTRSIMTIEVPMRNNVFVGCKLCKDTLTQIKFHID